MQDATRTYQTRVDKTLDSKVVEALCAYSTLVGHAERCLFSDICAGQEANALKSLYLIKHGLTARQFNALSICLKGKMDSIQELRKIYIADLQDKVKGVDNLLVKLKKKPSKADVVHQKQRRRHILKQRLEKLLQDQKEQKVRLCFGSKKLFHAQYDLEGNGYANHQEWLAAWHQARTSEIFIVGSKDETAGNGTCQATVEDGKISLRIRMPNALCAQYGQFITIPHLNFAHGHKEICAAVANCQHRKLLMQAKDPSYAQYGQALSYRLKYDEKGWRVLVTTSLPVPEWKSNKARGVIGIDVNQDHLALVETDRFGNPIFKQTIPLHLYGRSTDQSLALIGEACAQVIAHAEKTLKPVVIEKLDFQKKKQALREQRASCARQLSSFSYQAILTHLESRGFTKQIEVFQVNPAFTSLIGRVKFAYRYGLSIHHAAALCIGRRYLNVSEHVPSQMDKIPDGKDGHVALSAPVRKRGEHVWHLWRQLSKKLKAALAAHFRAKRSWDPPKGDPCDRPSPGSCRPRRGGTRIVVLTARTA